MIKLSIYYSLHILWHGFTRIPTQYRKHTPAQKPQITHVQVRANLHVVLCFSPVGEKLRIRARQFPALVNCTVLDWFHPWPAEVPPPPPVFGRPSR